MTANYDIVFNVAYAWLAEQARFLTILGRHLGV